MPQKFAGAQNKAVPERSISLPAGKVLGGTHSINAAAYVQGHASDFDDIAEELGDESWEFNKVRRFRRQLERTLDLVEFGMEQVGADEFVKTAKKALGMSYNKKPLNGKQNGIGPSYWTAEESPAGGLRVSTYDKFVKPMIHDRHDFKGKVDVVTHSMVEKLLFDPADDTKVTGVSTFNTRSNLAFEFHASKEVIISAGTYNSPKILMLSGIGPEEELKDAGVNTRIDLKGVGKNLRDHYAVATFWSLVDLPPASPFLFQQPSFNVFGPETTGPPSFQMELSGTFGSITPLCQDSVGFVKLVSSNPMEPLEIDPKVLDTPGDIDRMVEGLQTMLIPFFQSLVDQNLIAQASFSLSQTEEELRNFVINNTGTNHHPTGTCMIGAPDDDFAVVDKDFKVYGTKGLRVIDGSIFPHTPSANVNAAIMKTAMLGAHKVMDEYRSGSGKGRS